MAAREGLVAIVDALIAADANVNAANKVGARILCCNVVT